MAMYWTMWDKIKELAKRLKDKVTNNLKILGKWGAILCVFSALLLLLAPSIYLIIKYLVTSNGTYLASAIAWPTFLIAPAGGTGTLLFTLCLIITTTIGIKIKKGVTHDIRCRFKKIKIKRWWFANL